MCPFAPQKFLEIQKASHMFFWCFFLHPKSRGAVKKPAKWVWERFAQGGAWSLRFLRMGRGFELEPRQPVSGWLPFEAIPNSIGFPHGVPLCWFPFLQAHEGFQLNRRKHTPKTLKQDQPKPFGRCLSLIACPRQRSNATIASTNMERNKRSPQDVRSCVERF